MVLTARSRTQYDDGLIKTAMLRLVHTFQFKNFSVIFSWSFNQEFKDKHPLVSAKQNRNHEKIPYLFISVLYKTLTITFNIDKKGESIKGVSSPIRDHINDTGHTASIDDFYIIDIASSELDLLINESLFILRDRPTPNQQNSSIPLCLF